MTKNLFLGGLLRVSYNGLKSILKVNYHFLSQLIPLIPLLPYLFVLILFEMNLMFLRTLPKMVLVIPKSKLLPLLKISSFQNVFWYQ